MPLCFSLPAAAANPLQGHEAAATLLLKRCASLEAQDQNGDTALHHARKRADEPAGGPPLTPEQRLVREEQQVHLLRLLLDEAEKRQAGGAAQLVNTQAVDGCSCLHMATERNLLAAAELLLGRGADLT